MVFGLLGTAIVQGVMTTFGLWLTGVPRPVLLGVVAGVISILPVGAPLVWIPATLWLFVRRPDLRRRSSCWLYGAFGISSADNFIRPWLISRGADLPLLLTLLGALGGVFAFGFLGLFLGPVLLAVGYTLLKDWAKGAAEDEAASGRGTSAPAGRALDGLSGLRPGDDGRAERRCGHGCGRARWRCSCLARRWRRTRRRARCAGPRAATPTRSTRTARTSAPSRWCSSRSTRAWSRATRTSRPRPASPRAGPRRSRPAGASTCARGVRFHGGEPFTAEDVVFSIARAQQPTSNFGIFVDTIDRAVAVDERTVDIITKAPDPILPNKIISVYIMSKPWSEAHNVHPAAEHQGARGDLHRPQHQRHRRPTASRSASPTSAR